MKESRCNGLNCSQRLLLLQHFMLAALWLVMYAAFPFTSLIKWKNLHVCVTFYYYFVVVFARELKAKKFSKVYWESLMTHTRSSRNVCRGMCNKFRGKTIAICVKTLGICWIFLLENIRQYVMDWGEGKFN